MNPSRIFQTVFISNLTNPSRTSLSLLSYKIPSKKRCCHFLQRKTKTNHQPISQRFHQNTEPSLPNHITQMTEITTCQKLNNDILLSNNQSSCSPIRQDN
jgi:hypothetical protein